MCYAFTFLNKERPISDRGIDKEYIVDKVLFRALSKDKGLRERARSLFHEGDKEKLLWLLIDALDGNAEQGPDLKNLIRRPENLVYVSYPKEGHNLNGSGINAFEASLLPSIIQESENGSFDIISCYRVAMTRFDDNNNLYTMLRNRHA